MRQRFQKIFRSFFRIKIEAIIFHFIIPILVFCLFDKVQKLIRFVLANKT